MKAILIWSDGTEINTTIFEDKDGISGVDRARKQMQKEYREHGDTPDPEYGAFEGEWSCCYSNDCTDMCYWDIEELPTEKEKIIAPVRDNGERMELLGRLIDNVEDFLTEKGIQITNPERDNDPDLDNSAIIYGSDYDNLQLRFAETLGIDQLEEDKNGKFKEIDIISQLPADLIYATYKQQELEFRINDAMEHALDMGLSISLDDAKEIANRFIDNHDCNVSENAQFESIIKEYVKEKDTDREI